MWYQTAQWTAAYDGLAGRLQHSPPNWHVNTSTSIQCLPSGYCKLESLTTLPHSAADDRCLQRPGARADPGSSATNVDTDRRAWFSDTSAAILCGCPNSGLEQSHGSDGADASEHRCCGWLQGAATAVARPQLNLCAIDALNGAAAGRTSAGAAEHGRHVTREHHRAEPSTVCHLRTLQQLLLQVTQVPCSMKPYMVTAISRTNNQSLVQAT
jgi:hypothetical protein